MKLDSDKSTCLKYSVNRQRMNLQRICTQRLIYVNTFETLALLKKNDPPSKVTSMQFEVRASGRASFNSSRVSPGAVHWTARIFGCIAWDARNFLGKLRQISSGHTLLSP